MFKHHDCDVSSSSSEESSSSLGGIDVEMVKKAFEDPFKSLLERLRNKKCGMWEHCKYIYKYKFCLFFVRQHLHVIEGPSCKITGGIEIVCISKNYI